MVKGGINLTGNCDGINVHINTISGGIVNFGGAFKIAPVTNNNTTTGTSPSTSGATRPGIPTGQSGATGALGSNMPITGSA